MSAKERYQALLEEAAEFEKMVDPETSAGPSYWDDKKKSTRMAIADPVRKPNPDHVGGVHALSVTAANAVYYAFTTELMKQVWAKAAQELRARAAGMRGQLEKQRQEIDELLEGLK